MRESAYARILLMSCCQLQHNSMKEGGQWARLLNIEEVGIYGVDPGLM